jgi:hypothetical protein
MICLEKYHDHKPQIITLIINKMNEKWGTLNNNVKDLY